MAGTRIDMKNVVLFLKSATDLESSPNPTSVQWMALEFGEGNLTWTINDAAIEYMPDRGILDDVRAGDQAPLDISFEGKYTKIIRTAGTEKYSIAEMIKGYEYQETDHLTYALAGIREPWLVYDSTGADQIGCPPYACELEMHNNPKLSCGDISIVGEAQLFRYFRADSVAVDTRAAQISVTGKSNVIIPMVRRAITFDYDKIADAEPLTDWTKDPRVPF